MQKYFGINTMFWKFFRIFLTKIKKGTSIVRKTNHFVPLKYIKAYKLLPLCFDVSLQWYQILYYQNLCHLPEN